MGPLPFQSAASRESGFTLIEIAVVLLIVVVLLTLGASIASVATEAAAHSETRRKQEVIKDALSAYLGKHKRLPCPDRFDAMDGSEDRATSGDPTTLCFSAVGVGAVPYVDLGLARDMALDGWQNVFTYHVTTDAAVASDWTRSSVAPSPPSIPLLIPGKPGKLDVTRRNQDGAPPIPLTTALERAVVVLVSHGKNGLGARTSLGTQNVPPTGADEADNANADLSYISRDISDTLIPTFGAFDDLVAYAKASDLIAPLVKDGTVRTPEGETNYQTGIMFDEAVGGFLAAVPPRLPGTITARVDGWGTPMIYYPCHAGDITQIDPAPGTQAVRIISGGKDWAVNTASCAAAVGANDLVFDVTIDTVRALASKVGKALP